jgi:hypothetical protein
MYYQLAALLQFDAQTGNMDCQYVESDGGLVFTFYGFEGKYVDIWVPFKYIIARYTDGRCQFSMQPELDCSRGGDFRLRCASLGADFLRAAYIYVNYDNLTVSIAQAHYTIPHSWPVGPEDDREASGMGLRVQSIA